MPEYLKHAAMYLGFVQLFGFGTATMPRTPATPAKKFANVDFGHTEALLPSDDVYISLFRFSQWLHRRFGPYSLVELIPLV